MRRLGLVNNADYHVGGTKRALGTRAGLTRDEQKTKLWWQKIILNAAAFFERGASHCDDIMILGGLPFQLYCSREIKN